MSPSHRPATLTLPFAVLGLAGGAIVGYLFAHGGSHGPWMLLAITISTTLVAMRLGQRLTRSLTERPLGEGWWLPVVGRSLLAGGLNGVVLLVVMVVSSRIASPGGGEALGFMLFPGTLMAWLFGVVVSLPFIPSLVVMAGAHRRALGARPGSIAAQALTRRLWLATSGTSLVHLGLVVLLAGDDPWQRARPTLLALEWLLGGALAGTVVALSAEVLGWLRLRRAMAWAAGLARHDATRGAEAAVHPDLVDLGTGDAQFVTVEAGDNPYRAVDHRQLVLMGDPDSTRRALREATAWMLGGLALAVAPFSLVALYVACR